jgi:hypothetical protein
MTGRHRGERRNMNPHFLQSMIDRVRKGHAHSDHAIETINAIGEVGTRHAAIAARLEGDRNLTSVGRQSKLAEMVRNERLGEYARASRAVRKALGRFEAQRAGLGLPPADRTDVVGEMRRAELRGNLKGLAPGERLKRAQELASHPDYATVLFDMPAFASGLDDDALRMPESRTFDRLREAAIEKLHGPALAHIDAVEADYREVEQVAVHVRNELFKASGMSREGFEAAMQPLEAAADAG